MICTPSKFMYPSELVDMLEVDMFDENGEPKTPHWATAIDPFEWEGQAIQLTNSDLLEMALSHVVQSGLFAWDKRSDPFRIEIHMPCCGDFPRCLFFNAETNVIEANRASPLSTIGGVSGHWESRFLGLDLHKGHTALVSIRSAAKVISAVKSGKWRQLLEERRGSTGNIINDLMPMPLHKAIWAGRGDTTGTLDRDICLTPSQQKIKRAEVLDALPLETRATLTPKDLADIPEYVALKPKKSVPKIDLRKMRERMVARGER